MIRPPFSPNDFPHVSPKHIFIAVRLSPFAYLHHCDRWSRNPNGWRRRKYHSFHRECCTIPWNSLSSTRNNRWEIHASRILCPRHFCSTRSRAYYQRSNADGSSKPCLSSNAANTSVLWHLSTNIFVCKRLYKAHAWESRTKARINGSSDSRIVFKRTLYGDGRMRSPKRTWPRFSTGDRSPWTSQKWKLIFENNWLHSRYTSNGITH